MAKAKEGTKYLKKTEIVSSKKRNSIQQKKAHLSHNIKTAYEDIDVIINRIISSTKETQNYAEEEELLLGLQRHEEQAYRFLYDNFSRLLFTVIRQSIFEIESAEDILQELFIRVWQSINSYDNSKSDLQTWIISIARNLIINHINSEQSLKATSNPTTTIYLQNNILMPESSPKQENHLTPLEKMNLARTGISKKSLEHLKAQTTLDYDKLAKILAVTKATLINKKGNEKFNPSLSERIISLADLYSYGYEVFEDKTNFNQWMFSPNQALGGQTPHTVVDNQFGREEVHNIIGRIEYGVYS